MEQSAEKRVLAEKTKKGLAISDLILIAVLLAAGAVLKFFVGSIVNLGGMKPNFIIAMYCLAIMLVRPKLLEAGIIGLIAGAVCQFFPGTPYLNFASELVGALCMALMIKLPLKIKKVDLSPAVSTFISTIASGAVFVFLLLTFADAAGKTIAFFAPLVLGTALINVVIVQLLYIPLKLALKKKD